MNEAKLFSEGSATDLVCRGWSRERVIDATGIDPGYHNSSMKTELKGVDRTAYKIEHVRQRVAQETVHDVLEQYAMCDLDKAGVLEHLGLHDAVNLIKLSELYAALDMGDEFRDADRRSRRGVMQSGMIAQYGTDNPFKLGEYQEKAAQTREERYGARYTLAEGSVFADEARKKAQEKQSGLFPEGSDEDLRLRGFGGRGKRLPRWSDGSSVDRERYLVSHVKTRCSDDDINRALDVDNPSLSPVVQERRRQTMQERYGVDNPFASETVKEQIYQTVQEIYGVDYAVQSEAVQEQIRQTMRERYGVDYGMESPEIRARAMDTKRKKGTFNSSASEDALYELLVEYADHYGMTVVRQYCDEERYPFAVDFYIPERDLFIELNGSWSHGRHWYESDREMDQKIAQTWRKKGEKSKYYRAAFETWVERDVRKRAAAREAQLNYVTLWDGSESLGDAHLWFALGAPDGHDWDREYSWLDLLESLIDLREGLEKQVQQWVDIDVTNAGSRQISWLARSEVWETFYARELQMWETDEVHHRKWGRLRARLLANRLHYLGKLPESALEVVRGLAISGEIRSYSTFVNTAMLAVLDRYEPTHMYDPCSGWGERMLTCAQRGVAYTGTDISEAVVQSHQGLIDRLGLTNASVSLGDSATRDMRSGSHEMVLTCPPYGDTEIYTSDGAENLDDEAFLEWWKQVVSMSVAPSTRVFAFQISEKWRERMSTVAQSALGEQWHLADEIDASASRNHFQRAQSRQKHRGETMVVFERL